MIDRQGVSAPFYLDKQASITSFRVALLSHLMQAESLAQVGVSELLLESGHWSNDTINCFSILADLVRESRELLETYLLKIQLAENSTSSDCNGLTVG